jgi:predicted signal transduction protein with EAL and GGDEF domain
MNWIMKIIIANFVMWFFVFFCVVSAWCLVQVTGGSAKGPNYLIVGVGLLSALLSAVIVLLPFWVIFKKAGFHPATSLLMLVPLVNLATLYVLAFSGWKNLPAQKS